MDEGEVSAMEDQGQISCGTAQDTVQAIRAAERQGDVLRAYDIAQRGLADDGDDLWLRHRAVLDLARSGSTHFALAEFERLGLARLVERYQDIAGLRARLAKDLALASGGETRAAAARESAAVYRDAFRRWDGIYPAINAASMFLVAGERAEARDLARSTLAAIARQPASSTEDRYYAAASAAEAALILGDPDGARRHLAAASAASAIDHAARSSTRRQLRRVCALTGSDPAVLDALRPAACLYYVGHMLDRAGMAPRFPAALEPLARERLAAAIAAAAPDIAVGALACGTDILCAEILLARGTELHVVLPTDPHLFKQVSVAIGGPEWEARFDRCLAQATHVIVASPGARVLDDIAIGYGSRLAMGLTLARAQALDATAVQIALWDGAPPTAPCGTAADVLRWRRLGQSTIVVPPPGQCESAPAPPAEPAAREQPAAPPSSEIAILFADFAGYSKLDELDYAIFRDRILRPIADILNACGPALLHRNTWGDGLYLVFDDCLVAARCALQIRDFVAAVDWAQLGLSVPLSVRIGGHVGPLRIAEDPITLQPSFSGPHVVRAARIEPIAPPGEVLVTEAFAAFLALRGVTSLRVEYVGRRPTAKQYGEMRLFRLDAANPVAAVGCGG
jgi:hypothetical protein